MSTFQDYVIKDATKKRLEEHGLTVEVCQDSTADSPRTWTDSTFVGGEVRVPREVDRGSNFEEFVANYCRDILSCKITDIVWLTVYKYEHSGVAYSVEPFGDRWDSGIAGFIYETKEALRKEHNVKRISAKISESVKNRLTGEIETYSNWANGDVYEVGIESANQEYTRYMGWLLDEGDNLDTVANELIEEVLYEIDNNKDNLAIELAVSGLDDNETPIHHINSVLEDQFGVKLSTGNLKHDETLKTILSINDLPSFFSMAQQSSNNLFTIVSEKAVTVAIKYDHEQKTMDQYRAELTENKNYNDWSDTLKYALIETLLDDVDGIEVKSMSAINADIA
ncbi:MAG: hypothetical protein J6N72_07820 [Psychrobacter sp.]|nr:hypothetical protein [Psychrobacter sp.]